MQMPFANVQLTRDQIESILINNQVLLATNNTKHWERSLCILHTTHIYCHKETF